MFDIDWSHAWAGRIAAGKLVREKPFSQEPFLSLEYADDLIVQLEKMEGFLHQFKHMVLLGIGGSALGAKALLQAFFPQQTLPNHSGPWLWIMDNIDVDQISAMMSNLDPQETIVVVISKSGGTIETLAQYFLLRKWLQKTLKAKWIEHLLLITDEKSGFLRQEVTRLQCRSLPVPEKLGGRYSVLSAVGLVPASFLGLKWRDLLEGARDFGKTLITPHDLSNNPAWALAKWATALSEQDYNQLIFFIYIPAWSGFGQWFSQLWAESLGKDGKGTMPLPAVGVTDQHSLQQIFLDGPKDKGCIQVSSGDYLKGAAFSEDLPSEWSWLQGKHFGDLLDAECLGTAAALSQHNVPLVRIKLDHRDLRSAGSFLTFCMATTFFTGLLLDINPLDQPAVELGKRLARARLGDPEREKERLFLEQF